MPQTRFSKYFPLIFLVIDLCCLNTSILLASQLEFDSLITIKDYQYIQVVLNLLWVVIFFSVGLGNNDRNKGLLSILNKVLNGLVINLSIVFALWFIFQPNDYSRRFFFITYLLFALLIPLWRAIWHYAIRYYRKKGFNIRRVIIIGSGEATEEIKKDIDGNPEMGYTFQGELSDENISEEKLEKVIKENEPDLIICCINNLTGSQIKEIIDCSENQLVKVNLVSKISQLKSYNFSIDQFGNTPILKVNPIPLDKISNRVLKRIFDFIFSIFVFILLLSWLIPLIGLLIKFESKGPIFFKQKRHGKDNKFFTCWKFRTMTYQKNAEFKQAQKNDNRITKVGAILRKTSIDEIPQFINVFLGDMSVVGPRPHPIKLNEEFQPKIDRFWQRHAVKPGITGLAQARGFRGETAEFSDMSGRVKLDRFYVKNWSLVLDIKIIFLTVYSIIQGDKNAY